LYGDFSAGESVEFIEHGVKMLAHPLSGQKTGFYLDQKETRQIVRRLSKDKTVLNLFSYTGAGGISALMGGAYSVMNIDSSKWALSQCQLHATLNDLNTVKMATKETDVFQWLNNNRDEKFDMVIMDPPAIIKSQSGIDEGRKAYHFINRAAMRLLRKGGLFITSSCSQFLTVDDFATTLRRASVQNGLTLNVLKMISQAPDHPISVYFPESNYLKTFVCIVS
ncbi:MAG: class I SAM-dependent rRNA methyltransferase, partial [Candidatus Zixiibacteriota bacterium]